MIIMSWQSSVVDPVLHVVVVGFHHKKGCQVEYAYPPLIKGNDVASHGCPRKWRHLPSLALPDGAHNYPEDTIYFHLPSLNDSQTTIFGVSCCQQIDANEVLNKTEDVTRNTVQKSVCVLSRLPVFGLIRVKLEMITQAYFKGRDFSQVDLLEETYQTLNSSLTESLLQNSHIHLDLSGRDLLKQFRHKLVILFKLFLLEKKVLFYSSPVKPICTSILAIASLFPGLIEHGLFQSSKFDAKVTPTSELSSPFNQKSVDDSPDGTKSLSMNLNSGQSNKNISNNLTSSLQQLPQQKWHSMTLSNFRDKLFLSIKGTGSSDPAQSIFSASLPSILSLSHKEKNKTFMGNSTFYDVSSSKGAPESSISSYTQDVANSTFFVAPPSSSDAMFEAEAQVNQKSSINSNQAPIHFSWQAEKPRTQSITIDKNRKIGEDHITKGLPSKFTVREVKPQLELFQASPEVVSASSSHNQTPEQVHGQSNGSMLSEQNPVASCDVISSAPINLEDMLVDDDDDIIFREDKHRLEINEFHSDGGADSDAKELATEKDEKPRSSKSLSLHLTPSQHSTSSSSSISPSNDFGFPLKIFSERVLCHPYLSLHLYDILTDPSVKGFIIGATNALFKQRKQLLDVIVELSENKIEMLDAETRKCLTLSTADLRFADTLVRNLTEESGDPFLDNTGWEGGDDWIRSQFRSYLVSLLATAQHGDEKTEEDFNSSFIEAWKATYNYKVWLENGPYDALFSVPAQHLYRGNLSMSDVRLKISQVINNGGKERKITSVVNQTVTQTGKAVGAAVNLAKSTVTSWFGGFSSKE